jgi:serine/threonine protein kinase
MSSASDVIAQRLSSQHVSAQDVAECAQFVRAGGQLTESVLNAVVTAADRDAVFAEFAAPRAVVRVSASAPFGGPTDTQVGALPSLPTGAPAGDAQAAAFTDALLELLHQVCSAVEACAQADLPAAFLASRLAEFVTKRFAETFMDRAHLLTEAQRARVAPILRAVYARFPESRQFTRALLMQYVAKVLKEGHSAAPSPSSAVMAPPGGARALARIVETNEMAQMAPASASLEQKRAYAAKSPSDIAEDDDNDNDNDDSKRRFIASMHRQARPDPTGVHPSVLLRAARDQNDLKRRAVVRSASLYADDDEKRLLAALPAVLDLIGAVGGGLRASADAKHKAMFDLVERLVLRGGMMDELTALPALYHKALVRCLTSWCSTDSTGSLMQRVCSAVEHNWPLSSKCQLLLLHILATVLAVGGPLGARRVHLMRFLCGQAVLGGVDFAVQQRVCIMFDDERVRNAFFAVDDAAVAAAAVHSFVQALVTAAQTTFSASTRKMCVRAACLVAAHSPAVQQSDLVLELERQRADERAVEEQEAALKRRRRRERRTDLTFMKLAWHRQLGTGALATVRSALAIEPGVKQSLWTEYAIKVMLKEQIAAENARARIEAEAVLLESLNHRNVIGFVAFFEDEKRIFLAMELAGGGDVHTVLVRMGSVDAAWAQFVTAEAAAALAYLHEHSIVHFDVKPENLLLDSDGHVLLADFGSCLVWDAANGRASAAGQESAARVLLTSTAEYLSFELASNALASNEPDAKALYVDAALAGASADWWALGVTLYQLLRGRVPYSAPVRRGAESEPQTDRVKLQAVVQQAQTLGPLFVHRGAPEPLLDQCEAAVRALLNRDAAQRWTSRTPAAAAFFSVPPVPPKAPARGLVAASEVASHDKQRKYSMFTAMAQHVFRDEAQQTELEPVLEIEGF